MRAVIYTRVSTQEQTKNLSLDTLDLDTVLNFADYVLNNPGHLWRELPIDQQQQFQRVLFPDGMTFADKRIGTAKTSFAFSYLQAFVDGKEEVVTPRGFEPRLPP